MKKIKQFLGSWWIILVPAAMIPIYVLIAINNEHNVDYVNNGFFTFWLSGKFIWTGQNPYSSADWVAGHHLNGATWIPNKIFPYPLPLALLMAPLGLLQINDAYILWDVFAQVIIACCAIWLAKHWTGLNHQLYAVFVLFALVLNGNIYLGVMTGTIAALFLLILCIGLYLLETRRPILAGIALAGLALKPPLLTIAALLGFWLLIRRDWKAIAGLGLGGMGLIVTGLFQDPKWIGKFIGASENLLGMRLGHQPTILSYTRLVCAGDQTCAMVLYSIIGTLLIGLFAWLTWKNFKFLSPLQAFSAAIALGVLLPPYLWSYDYTLLVIPICFISFDLVRRRSSYLYATIFLLMLDVISTIGMFLFWMNPASDSLTIQRDMWSIWVAVLVLITTWWMVYRRHPENANP